MNNSIESFVNIGVEDFWNGDPYDEVIIATGSIRKALMLISQNFKDFSFVYLEDGQEVRITNPTELDAYFTQNVYNGNGSLAEKTLLGYLHGVPVFAEPSNGETASNKSPYREAVNKVMDLYQQKYAGQKVWIISTDTVDKPNEADEPLGKPENEEGFPQMRDYVKFGEEAKEKYLEAVAEYLQNFKDTFYTVSSEIVHTNAIAILDAMSGLLIDLGENNLINLNIPIDQQKLADAKVHQDAGGGGMTQQLVDWDNPEQVKEYFGELTQELLEGKSDAILKMALYCQISGMPYAIIELLRLAHEELHEIKAVAEGIVIGDPEEVDAKETVVFDAGTMVGKPTILVA